MFVHVLIVVVASIYQFKANSENVKIVAPQYKAWLYQFLDQDTDFNALTDDIERRKTFYKLSNLTEDIRGYVDGYYDLAVSEQDSEAHAENGILFGDISLDDPNIEGYEVTPPRVQFRYLTSGQSPSKEMPFSHTFQKVNGAIDYGPFEEGVENLEKFKAVYQHLSNMQIDYFVYVKLDSDLYNGRTYKWQVM